MSSPLRCAVLDDYQHAVRQYADWSSLEKAVRLQVFNEHFTGKDKLVEMLEDFDIIVLMRERTPFQRSLIERLPKLKLLVTTGSRNGSIDLAACQDNGIVVCGTRNSDYAAAELTWALILAHRRNIVQEAVNLRNAGNWQSTVGSELSGRTLGVIGLGRLGSRVATIGLAFGMDVVAWSHNLTEARCEQVGVRHTATLKQLLTESDIVTVHLVLSERTRHLIGKKELAYMKRDALLVNTSRAAIVSETALIEALPNGNPGGAALDVFECEPLPRDHVLRTMPQVTATPHLGYVTAEAYRIFFSDAVEDISRWLLGDPIRVITDPHPATISAVRHP